MSSGDQQKAPISAEHARLAEGSAAAAGGNWKLVGPYVADRAWGTVREDYSADGDAWRYFPFDHAHSRPSRRSESSASAGRRAITARTRRNIGGLSTRRRPTPGCAGATTIRKPSFRMRASGKKVRTARASSRNSSFSTPAYLTAIDTGKLRRTTPRQRRTTS